MANLYIAEYQELARDVNGQLVLAPKDPPVAEQTVAIGAASAQSAAFQKSTRFIRIKTRAGCHVVIDSNPTATTAKAHFESGQTEIRGVNGQDKLAVIQE